jgi:hypothetical protein
MSYRISLDEIDGCLIVTDGKRTVKVERFATDGIREVYGHTVELLDSENAKLREDLEFERSENGWAREFLNRMGRKCGTKDCPSLVAYVTKLEAENAKLRELVALQREFSETICGHKCKRKDEYCGFRVDEECHYEHDIYDRMAELGIEVKK